MLDDLAAFVSLTIPTRGEEGEVIVAGALLRHPPLPQCGRGAGGEGHPQTGGQRSLGKRTAEILKTSRQG